VPLLSSAIDNSSELSSASSFEPILAENDSRMQKAYRDTTEINQDVDSISTSINSLIESLGLDPALLASSLSNQTLDMPPQPSASSNATTTQARGLPSLGGPAGTTSTGNGNNNTNVSNIPHTAGGDNNNNTLDPFRSTPEFDFDAFLTEYPSMNTIVQGIHGGDMDPAAHIASIVDENGAIDVDAGDGGSGNSITDATAEQQLAFLDEVASQSDTNSVKTASPELRPTSHSHATTMLPSNLGAATIAGRGHKRKSDVAELEDITARMNGSVVLPGGVGGNKIDSNHIGQNIKTRRKRQE
jgi:hypothetical protein